MVIHNLPILNVWKLRKQRIIFIVPAKIISMINII